MKIFYLKRKFRLTEVSAKNLYSDSIFLLIFEYFLRTTLLKSENKSHSIIIIIVVVAFFFTNDESVVGVLSFPPSSN